MEDGDKLLMNKNQTIRNQDDWMFIVKDKKSKNTYYIQNSIFYCDPMNDGGSTVIVVRKSLFSKSVYNNNGLNSKLNNLVIKNFQE